MLPSARILSFWFGREDAPRSAWFDADATFDAEVRDQFEGVLHEALRGSFVPHLLKRDDRLALVVLTDQMPRNMYRGTKEAFVGEEVALACAKQMIASGQDEKLPAVRRMFVYLPFEHAEDIRLQGQSLLLFRKLAAESKDMQPALEAALKHYEAIAKFGRFPQRNTILRRRSSNAEVAFLASAEAAF